MYQAFSILLLDVKNGKYVPDRKTEPKYDIEEILNIWFI